MCLVLFIGRFFKTINWYSLSLFPSHPPCVCVSVCFFLSFPVFFLVNLIFYISFYSSALLEVLPYIPISLPILHLFLSFTMLW